MCVCLCRMDGVPLKMPEGASHEVIKEVVKKEVIVPDYLTRLQETEVSVHGLFCDFVYVGHWKFMFTSELFLKLLGLVISFCGIPLGASN